MSDTSFSHLIEIDEENRRLTIYRVFPDGRRQLCSKASLPRSAINSEDAIFAQFARTLGQDILMDSPAARRAIGL